MVHIMTLDLSIKLLHQMLQWCNNNEQPRSKKYFDYIKSYQSYFCVASWPKQRDPRRIYVGGKLFLLEGKPSEKHLEKHIINKTKNLFTTMFLF